MALADARELLFQEVHAHALVVERDAADVGLVGAERLERAQVGGAFRQHDVAGVQKRLGNEVERFLSARGDHDVLGLGAHADVAHEVAEHLLRLHAAVGRAVLQRHDALVVAGGAGGRADGGVGQQRHVGMPPDSEMMLGFDAAANRSRTAEERIFTTRSAILSPVWSNVRCAVVIALEYHRNVQKAHSIAKNPQSDQIVGETHLDVRPPGVFVRPPGDAHVSGVGGSTGGAAASAGR